MELSPLQDEGGTPIRPEASRIAEQLLPRSEMALLVGRSAIEQALSECVGPMPMLFSVGNYWSAADDDREDEEATIVWGGSFVDEDGIERNSGDAMTVTFHGRDRLGGFSA